MKESRPYNHTPKTAKIQHAQNLANCGALEREGNRAKERNTRHSTPKTPHIKRKPMRQSKHTHERQTRHTCKKCAHHGKGGEGEPARTANATPARKEHRHGRRHPCKQRAVPPLERDEKPPRMPILRKKPLSVPFLFIFGPYIYSLLSLLLSFFSCRHCTKTLFSLFS